MKKQYFRESTLGEIKKKGMIDISDNLISNILDIEDHSIVFNLNLIPGNYDSSKRFLKHGNDVKLPRFSSLDSIIENGETAIKMRDRVFNNIPEKIFSGYTIKPVIGNDKITRKVSLVECVEGAKLYCYANQNQKGIFNSTIDVKAYDDSNKVAVEGAEIIVSVPSRSIKQPKSKFKFSSVPVFDHERKFGIANNVVSDHVCDNKRFNIRYTSYDNNEYSKQINFCAHEIAGFLSIIDFYKNEKYSITPYEMNHFAIPSQETVDFYNKLCNNCLIEDGKPRKLNKAEKEILLWGLVSKKGSETFKPIGKLKDYNW